jgi:uncharacterized membrane protein YeaQ/YmgE (transglycosylase-associated protein family)
MDQPNLAIDANCACDVVALKVEDVAPKWVAATRLIETSPQGTFGRCIAAVNRRVGAMSGQGLLVILVIGLIAGWLAGHLVRGTGFGLVADICIGIVGALIGSWLLPQLGIHLAAGMLSAIITATIGAVLLLVVLRLFRGRGRW